MNQIMKAKIKKAENRALESLDYILETISTPVGPRQKCLGFFIL